MADDNQTSPLERAKGFEAEAETNLNSQEGKAWMDASENLHSRCDTIFNRDTINKLLSLIPDHGIKHIESEGAGEFRGEYLHEGVRIEFIDKHKADRFHHLMQNLLANTYLGKTELGPRADFFPKPQPNPDYEHMDDSDKKLHGKWFCHIPEGQLNAITHLSKEHGRYRYDGTEPTSMPDPNYIVSGEDLTDKEWLKEYQNEGWRKINQILDHVEERKDRYNIER